MNNNNKKKNNQTMSTRHLLLTWVMGKQSMSLSVERTSFSVYRVVKKILEIKTNQCLLGRNIEIVFLSQKLEILENGNTHFKYLSIFLLKIGVGVQ